MSGFYGEQSGNQNYGWGEYNMGEDQSSGAFQQDNLGFQSFDYSSASPRPGGGAAAADPYLQPSSGLYAGSVLTPEPVPQYQDQGEFDQEPPLLEELGINPDHIMQKTLSALNPFRETDAAILQDTDLAGPLMFCLAFGGLLLLTGKLHFGYIYGIGLMGCVAMYFLLNLMSMQGVTLGVVVSVLGYCLLPMVFLSGVSIVLSLQGSVGMLLAGLTILWCSLSASKLFITVLAMDHQQPLVGYPCALLYGVFALLTIF